MYLEFTMQGSRITCHLNLKLGFQFFLQFKNGGALFNDVRRDDGGSAAITLQSLANKDYGAIKNRRRGVTARDGCGTFNKDCLIS